MVRNAIFVFLFLLLSPTVGAMLIAQWCGRDINETQIHGKLEEIVSLVRNKSKSEKAVSGKYFATSLINLARS